jgi:hypothetical protein
LLNVEFDPSVKLYNIKASPESEMLLLTQNMESTEFLLVHSKTLHPLYKENVSVQDCQITENFLSYRYSNEFSGGSTKLDILDLELGQKTSNIKSYALFKDGEKADELKIIGDTKNFKEVLRVIDDNVQYNAKYIEFRDFYTHQLYHKELAYHS